MFKNFRNPLFSFGAETLLPHHYDLGIHFLNNHSYQNAVDHLTFGAVHGHTLCGFHLYHILSQEWHIDISASDTQIQTVFDNVPNFLGYPAYNYIIQKSPQEIFKLRNEYLQSNQIENDSFSKHSLEINNVSSIKHNDPLLLFLDHLYSFPLDGGKALVNHAVNTKYPSSIMAVLNLEIEIPVSTKVTFFDHVDSIISTDILFKYRDLTPSDSELQSITSPFNSAFTSPTDSIKPPPISTSEYRGLFYRSAFPNFKELFQEAFNLLEANPEHESPKRRQGLEKLARAVKCEYPPAVEYMAASNLNLNNIFF